jgi:hypothetical protein
MGEVMQNADADITMLDTSTLAPAGAGLNLDNKGYWVEDTRFSQW